MTFPDLQQTMAMIEGGRAGAVIPELERLAERLPAYAAAHALLARAYEAEARPGEARAAWQRVRFLVPNSPAAAEGLRRVVAAAEPSPAAEGGPLGTGIGDTFEDLDRLIEELERARIEPSPEVDNAPAPNLEDDLDDMVSETLARIYAAQGQYREAARVYNRLASQEPARASAFLEKAADMQARAEEHEH